MPVNASPRCVNWDGVGDDVDDGGGAVGDCEGCKDCRCSGGVLGGVGIECEVSVEMLLGGGGGHRIVELPLWCDCCLNTLLQSCLFEKVLQPHCT